MKLNSDRLIDIERLQKAYEIASGHLLQERTEDGHWIGELSTSALSTATAVSALSAFQRSSSQTVHQRMIDAGVDWLIKHQNSDGGWGDTRKSYSNISTTLLAIASFHMAGCEKELEQPIADAKRYVDKKGGIPGLKKRYGRDKTFAVPILANCAIAGTVPWKTVAALPFEAACVPQKFYHLMQLPVVSYAIPALVAIGQAKYFHDPPWNPVSRIVRKFSIGRSLRVLEKMQPASGGFLEAIPLTSFVVMGLASTGRHDHPVVQNGIKFIVDSVLADGSWPIDTNLATWTTTLSVNALDSVDNAAPTVSRDLTELNCLDWILGCQNKTVHPFTNSPPGGWGWTDLSGAVPDADDTPGALLALDKIHRWQKTTEAEKNKIEQAAELGVSWLLKLQNRDLGWPTFCRGWGKLPFDRSGSDITAHCIRGINAWKGRVDISVQKIEKAISGAMDYLQRKQNADGSWLPLWFGNQDHPEEENPVYGTAKVLAAYYDLDRMESSEATRGLNWIAENQNPDGSWGGGKSSCGVFGKFGLGRDTNPGSVESDRIGSVEETALALEALFFSKDSQVYRNETQLGLQWLVEAVEADCHRIDSPIGFYFAKLWYHERLYPQIFTVSALGRALSKS